eukprot:PhF_6_TR12941/c0_g1_i1/m.20423
MLHGRRSYDEAKNQSCCWVDRRNRTLVQEEQSDVLQGNGYVAKWRRQRYCVWCRRQHHVPPSEEGNHRHRKRTYTLTFCSLRREDYFELHWCIGVGSYSKTLSCDWWWCHRFGDGKRLGPPWKQGDGGRVHGEVFPILGQRSQRHDCEVPAKVRRFDLQDEHKGDEPSSQRY